VSRHEAADLPSLHRRALTDTEAVVARVRPAQWRDPTPCSEWNVYDLLSHIVRENLWVPELMKGNSIEAVGDRFDGDVLGHDPLGAYQASARPAAEAFEQPGALEQPVPVSYGPVPGRVYLGHRFLDVLVHCWDLAAATGPPTQLDPELVEALWQLVVEPEGTAGQPRDWFDQALAVSADADLQTRLLGRLGRRA
jgi:uncharacterized protein (TIGR03086 family)